MTNHIATTNIKNLVKNNKEFNEKFRALIKGIAHLYAYQARTSEYSMSPERVIIRRESEIHALSVLIGQAVKLNREYDNGFFCCFIRDFGKVSTKWDILDEIYETAMSWLNEEEEDMYNVLFPRETA